MAQFAHFALQRPDALVLGRGRAGAPALIALGLANPVAQSFRRATGSFRAGLYSLAGALVLAALLTFVFGAFARVPLSGRSRTS